MAIKAGYVIREVGINLTRNISLTLATVATVAVSLTLVGSAYLIGEGVQDAQAQFEGGVEFIIFMQPEAADAQIDAVRAELDANPQVADFEFCDKACAFEEFQELFADDPQIRDSVEADELPASFKVRPEGSESSAQSDLVETLGAVFDGQPGVREVVFSSEAIERIERFYDFLSSRSALAALALVGAATLLVLNTIQMAILNRRRDIEVMKLVGATNWFIRVPFMLEGLVQGVVGALLAIGLLAGLWPYFQESLPNPDDFALLRGFEATTPETMLIYGLIGAIGCIVGAVGAGVAVTRFLDI